MSRRWRGYRDVPLSLSGRLRSSLLTKRIELDIVYHDHLQRCRDTAYAIKAGVHVEDPGPRPWGMGHLFEGHEIDEDSLNLARYYIRENPLAVPPGGEAFARWAADWKAWLRDLKTGFAHAGIVTHNRNIQFLYSMHNGEFEYKLYDCDGPDFCTVHVYDPRNGAIAPWGGKTTVPGLLYLVRHGDTEWGT